MSTADPFLPEQGDDEIHTDATLDRQDHDSEDQSRPDVFPGSPEGNGEPQPVDSDAVFRTPTGEAVEPASD